MKLPRDITGQELVHALTRLGYAVDRQTGSHISISTERKGKHHVTIPAHSPLKVGTLSAILREVADHAGLSREQLLQILFG